MTNFSHLKIIFKMLKQNFNPVQYEYNCARVKLNLEPLHFYDKVGHDPVSLTAVNLFREREFDPHAWQNTFCNFIFTIIHFKNAIFYFKRSYSICNFIFIRILYIKFNIAQYLKQERKIVRPAQIM